MYAYSEFDQQFIDERVAEYRSQTERFLAGELSEDEFRPIRLRNGLYIQRLAPMLRVAIPYGTLSSRQMRMIAHIARHYDKGYAHFSTRQNVQFNWPMLEEVPDLLADLASVQMHAIQTSGNCIRNVTTDQYAGVAADEIFDTRPYCELLRQWSTSHPEFDWLPRKFKIAVNGAGDDRAATNVHDIGIDAVLGDNGERGFRIKVGGGLGRTPQIASTIREFLPERHLLSYVEAIMRVYNRYGRRDNKYKARIKILVKAMSPDTFRERVDAEWAHLEDGPATLTQAEIDRVVAMFAPPTWETLPDNPPELDSALADAAFARWHQLQRRSPYPAGYAIVNLSLKNLGIAPGDLTDRQIDQVADLADRFSMGELRVTHEQNLVFPYVEQRALPALREALDTLGVANPNIGLLSDMICCPGGDFCALANAKSIPVAEAIAARFDDLDYLYDLGPIDLNISGCMNACGHHHVGNIGILGVDKKGEEWYQVSLGGNARNDSSLADIIGPSFSRDEVPDVVGTILDVYLESRHADEDFVTTYRRIGLAPFKERVYAKGD